MAAILEAAALDPTVINGRIINSAKVMQKRSSDWMVVVMSLMVVLQSYHLRMLL